MNPNIAKLTRIADKPDRLIIGLMSGTSLDGLDIALCRVDAHGTDTTVQVLHFETVAYDDDYRDSVRSVFSKRDVDLQVVCLLNAWIGLQHGKAVLSCLHRWRIPTDEVDLVASHGQTIYHCPKHLHGQARYPNATLQIGDGDHLAHTLGIITCSDFRQKHIAAGGEGAPLAMYGDYFIFSDPIRHRIMLNIGGIANLTWLPCSLDAAAVISTDVGPGNTIMDAFVQRHCAGLQFDTDSRLARNGKISPALLDELKSHSFFARSLPKTIGPELFNLEYLQQAKTTSKTQQLSVEDQMATLNRFSADMIVDAICTLTRHIDSFDIYTSGGGMHNSLLIENIRQQLRESPIKSTSELGVDPDAKEAVVFAVLANECVAGDALRVGEASLPIRPVSMGKISFPD